VAHFEARAAARAKGSAWIEDYNTRRHRALNQAAPLPDGVTDLDHFRVRRCDRAGGVMHEHRLVA
jgi:hypothetical protein